MKNNLIYQVQQLLLKNQISFDKEELAFQIESHPSYPSLHAVTGVLSHFSVENIALDVPVDEGTVAQLPTSFLAQVVTEEGKEFAVVTNKKENVALLFSAKDKRRMSLSQFLDKFTGIVVAVEKDENQKEVNTSNTFLNNSIILLLGIVLIGLGIVSKPDVLLLIYTLMSFVGIYISLSLIQQDLGLETVLGNAFCSQTSEKSDCQAILSSKGAEVFGSYKLSDLSVVYFSAHAFTSLIFLIQGASFSLSYGLSFLALPITLYSIYYQYVVVKKWCRLCLSIVALLWIQAGFVLVDSSVFSTFSFSIEHILVSSVVFLAVVAGWSFLSPHIKKLQELRQTKIDYFKFKKNYALFSSLLEKSAVVDTHIAETSEIIIGNREAALSLTIITNPFCGHCKAVHALVEDLYKTHARDLQICIRFNINTNDPTSDIVMITTRILEIYHTQGIGDCMEAMHEIYNGETPSDWLTKWKTCECPAEYMDILKNEQEWCIQNSINFTPEILINGKSYPGEYDRSDLTYFIEDLSESCLESTNVITPNLEPTY